MNDILAEIKAKLVTALGPTITTYYTGEVEIPPKSYLPALMIYGTRTTQMSHGTAKDEVTHEITIRVVIDLATKFTESGTGVIIKAQDTLMDIMEDRDSSGVAVAASVVGVLRRNIKGTLYLFNNNLEINYRRVQRGEFSYAEAELTVGVTRDLAHRQ